MRFRDVCDDSRGWRIDVPEEALVGGDEAGSHALDAQTVTSPALFRVGGVSFLQFVIAILQPTHHEHTDESGGRSTSPALIQELMDLILLL